MRVPHGGVEGPGQGVERGQIEEQDVRDCGVLTRDGSRRNAVARARDVPLAGRNRLERHHHGLARRTGDQCPGPIAGKPRIASDGDSALVRRQRERGGHPPLIE